MHPVKTYKGRGILSYDDTSMDVDYEVIVFMINGAYKANGKIYADFSPTILIDFDEGKLKLQSGDIVEVISVKYTTGSNMVEVSINSRMPDL